MPSGALKRWNRPTGMRRLPHFASSLLGSALLCSLLPATLAANGINEGGEWVYQLYTGGSQLGISRVVSTMIRDGELETKNNVWFELIRGVQRLGVTLNARTVYRWPEGRPLKYEMTFAAGRVPAIFTGVFSEKDSTIRVKTGPEEYMRQIALEGDEYILDDSFILDHYLVMLATLNLDETTEVHFLVPQRVQQEARVFGMQLRPRGVEEFVVGAEEWKGLRLEAFTDTGLKMNFWLDPEDRILLRWTVPSQTTEVVLSKDTAPPDEAAN